MGAERPDGESRGRGRRGAESEWDAEQPGTAWEDGGGPKAQTGILERTPAAVGGGWMLREVLSVVLAEETKQ